MKPRSLLILTLVVAALAAFVWFYERKLPSTEEAKEQEKKLLAGVETDEVSEVTIAREGKTVRLVREGKPAAKDEKDEDGDDEEDEESALPPPAAEWRLAAPLQARADRSAVEGLLSSLLGLDKATTIEKPDRKQYGLDPPAATVTLQTDDGTKTIEVGRELPGMDQRAVAIQGEAAVHAVASSFWSDLTREPGDWRSRELFPGSRDDVERVSLQHGGGKVLLARRGEEPWLEAPLADRADQERFDQLLDAVTSLQALEFVDEPPGPPAALGLEPPQAVVEIVRKGESRPFRLALGAAEPSSTPPLLTPESPESDAEPPARYARADGQLVTLRSAQLDEAVARPAQDWRSRAWSPFAVYEVDKAEVADGKGKLVLTRDEGDWKRGDVKIFYGPVSDFLGAVADAKAEQVLDPTQAQGLTGGPPAMTITLTGSGGKKQTLLLWPGRVEGPAGAGAPAKSGGRDATLMMGAGLPGDLAEKLAAVRKAEPLEETPTPTPKP